MEKKHYNTEMDGLRAQIKHWRTIAYGAGAGFLLMAAANLSLIGDTRIVLTPPDINKTFWVEKGNASPEYIEQMSLFFLSLMMDVTPGNVEYKYNIIKSYLDSEVYGAIETDLAVNAEPWHGGRHQWPCGALYWRKTHQ
ncbi:MAG: hypothetical protein HY052_03875 [Proteobacteria bacterium]|nr:hypothetical protein [Pseudomonadota bacterium]